MALGRAARCGGTVVLRAVENGVGNATALVANGELRELEELIVIFSVRTGGRGVVSLVL